MGDDFVSVLREIVDVLEVATEKPTNSKAVIEAIIRGDGNTATRRLRPGFDRDFKAWEHIGRRLPEWRKIATNAIDEREELQRLRMAITAAASILHASFARPGREVASAAGQARKVLLEAIGRKAMPVFTKDFRGYYQRSASIEFTHEELDALEVCVAAGRAERDPTNPKSDKFWTAIIAKVEKALRVVKAERPRKEARP